MSPTGGEEKPSRGGRTRAREVVFRAVFEVDLTGDDLLETLELSLGRFRFTQDGRAFALRLATGAVEHRARIDALLEGLLRNWSIDRISTVVRAILRVALAEMLSIAETPVRVILDEAVRLAGRYGEAEAGSFANGVLDAAARRIRPGELPPAAGAKEAGPGGFPVH